MSFVIKKLTDKIFLPFSKLQYMPVRYRYHADKIRKGPIVKGYGYEDPIFQKGLLPRLKDAEVLPGPIYRPGNPWNPDKARFGQNDYIDLLGGGRLKPHEVIYDIPKWLRGKKGNEFQLLVLKQKVFGGTRFETDHPTQWFNIRRRFKYLYKFLNRKTKTGLMRD